MTKFKIEFIEFNSDSFPAVAVIRMPEDTPKWWDMVTKDAMERECIYGLDETEEPVTLSDDTYDEALVVEWCKRHVLPPQWRWHRKNLLPFDDRDDDNLWTLGSLDTRPNKSWWSGAVVEVGEQTS